MKLEAWLATALVAGVLCGCPSKEAEEGKGKSESDDKAEPEKLDPIAQQFSASGVIVHKHEKAQVAWTVDDDGTVKAALRTAEGTPIKKAVDGELSWKDADGKTQTAKLELDAETGLLEAKNVTLPPGSSDVDYKLDVKGDTVNGNLPFPKRALGAASAPPAPAPPPKAAASEKPAATTAPQPTSKSGRSTENTGRFPEPR